MPKGPIPLRIHALIEPVVGVLLIVAPWLFGFDDVGSSTAVSIVVGAIMLVSGATTRWRWSLVKLIPLRTHFMTDLALGVVLIVAPFVLGDSDRGDATRFLVIMGVLELVTAVSTRWDKREEVAPRAPTSADRTGPAATR
jgi:SPW repeat